SVAHLHEPELQLHDSKHMLDLTTHSRFVSVPGPLDFIDPVFIATAPLGAVAGAWRTLMDDLALALIRPVAPHPGLFPVQQLRQHHRVSHIGWRRYHR